MSTEQELITEQKRWAEETRQARIEGGKQAAEKNKARDPDFYKNIGSLGGSKPTAKLKGWAAMKANNPERLSQLSRNGGKKSRRSKR